MKITFHGAARVVTGSKHLVELDNGTRFLLDCGMFQGMGKETFELNTHFGFSPRDIDFMILSHAHIDHSGLIPRLVREGFKGKIYCTPATFDLCEIMLADSAYILEQDVAYVNKRRKRQGKTLFEPVYTVEDLEEAMKLFIRVNYDKETKINDHVSLLFTDNGHILGSAAVNLTINEGGPDQRLFFSGDIGRYNTAILRDPHSFPQPDYIICESTYGNRKHDTLDMAGQAVMDAVIDTIGRKKGRLIIPAFSLGRTQEIVFMLNKLDLHGLIPDVKIYVDSPLSVSATQIMRKHINCLDDEIQRFMEERPDPFGFDDLQYIRDINDSKHLNELTEPFIVISASGMAEAGRVKHHIKNGIGDPRNTILIVGYAEPQSLAGQLRNGAEEVRIFGEEHKVRADVRVVDGLSAHADYEEMLRYLSSIDPQKVRKTFLVHGDFDAQEHWKVRLHDAGFRNIFIPEMHESIVL